MRNLLQQAQGAGEFQIAVRIELDPGSGIHLPGPGFQYKGVVRHDAYQMAVARGRQFVRTLREFGDMTLGADGREGTRNAYDDGPSIGEHPVSQDGLERA